MRDKNVNHKKLDKTKEEEKNKESKVKGTD